MGESNTIISEADMPASGFSIPPATIPVRIYSPNTKAYLYTGAELKYRVYTTDGTIPKDNQWFFIDADATDPKKVLVRSAVTEQWISLTVTMGDDEIYTFSRINDDEKFQLQPGSGPHAGQFRIYCPLTKLYAVATSKSPPGVYKLPGGESENAWWQFVYKDPILVSLKYEIGHGKLIGSAPLELNSATFGPPDKDTRWDFTTTELVDTSYVWSFDSSFSFPQAVNGEVGVPVVVANKIELRKRSDLKFKFGEALKYPKKWNESFPFDISAGTKVQAAASVTKSTVEVPFTAKFRSGSLEFDVKGMCRGTTTHDYKLKVEYHMVTDANAGGEPIDL